MWYGWIIFVHFSTALAANGFEMGETGSQQLWEGSNRAAGAQVMAPHPRVRTGIFLTSPPALPETRTAPLREPKGAQICSCCGDVYG